MSGLRPWETKLLPEAGRDLMDPSLQPHSLEPRAPQVLTLPTPGLDGQLHAPSGPGAFRSHCLRGIISSVVLAHFRCPPPAVAPHHPGAPGIMSDCHSLCSEAQSRPVCQAVSFCPCRVVTSPWVFSRVSRSRAPCHRLVCPLEGEVGLLSSVASVPGLPPRMSAWFWGVRRGHPGALLLKSLTL